MGKILKRLLMICILKDLEQLELSDIAGGSVKMVHIVGKQFDTYLKS